MSINAEVALRCVDRSHASNSGQTSRLLHGEGRLTGTLSRARAYCSEKDYPKVLVQPRGRVTHAKVTSFTGDSNGQQTVGVSDAGLNGNEGAEAPSHATKANSAGVSGVAGATAQPLGANVASSAGNSFASKQSSLQAAIGSAEALLHVNDSGSNGANGGRVTAVPAVASRSLAEHHQSLGLPPELAHVSADKIFMMTKKTSSS